MVNTTESRNCHLEGFIFEMYDIVVSIVNVSKGCFIMCLILEFFVEKYMQLKYLFKFLNKFFFFAFC